MADYKTIRGTSTFEYEEKRSRFIATAAFADTEEKALAVLNAVRAANRTRATMSMPMCCRTAERGIPMTASPPKLPGPRCWRRSATRVWPM